MTDAPDSRFSDEPTLGDLLRQARESRGLDLSEVAELTHVRREYLAALEEGRYSELPEDVYTKNFLRLYAQAVGFDVVRAQELYRSERRELGGFNTVEQRLERDNELSAEMQPVEGSSRWWETPGQGARWGSLLSTMIMVGAVVALALWGFNSTFFNPSRSTTNDVNESEPALTGTESAGAAEATQDASVIPRTVRLSVSSNPPGAEVSVDEFPLPGSTPIESAPVTARPSRTIRVTLEGYEPAEAEFDLTYDRNLSFALSPLGTQAPEVEAAEAEQGTESGTTPVQNGGTADDEGEAAQGPVATLAITEDTWLEVYRGTARNQGQRLAFTTARAGQTLNFPLPIYVHVGNAGGVELSVNGQDRGPLGSSGEVRGLAITQQQ